jgi:4-hydroxy-tetrahydrodipicolinate synthase
MGRFGQVVTAMVTAFDTDGGLDLDTTAQLAAWLVDNGSDALVVTGTTGEVSVLGDDEHVEVWRAVRAAVDVPVIGGSGSNDTASAVAMTARAAAAGLDGVLVVTPYYNRPSQQGLDAHFRAVAAATDLPVMLYDIPVRSGRRIDPGVLVRLATEVPNIVAVKDATGDVAGAAWLVANTPDDFELYSGDDALTLPLVAVGAVGVVSVCSHWAGAHMGAMVAAAVAGERDRARMLNAQLLASYAFESSDAAPNPIPTKVMLGVLGHPVGNCRLPLGPPPDGLADTARQVAAGLAAAPPGETGRT